MAIQKGDFIELDYTGKLGNGEVFDTTIESVAHEQNLPHEHGQLKPSIICVGEQQVLPGLDAELEGKEVNKEFSVTLPAEKAFGKRDVKKIRIVPISTFKDHDLQPQPGLQIDMDGQRGTITRVAGGRVIVNFNHPLAGKEVKYDVKILRVITDKAEQIKNFLSSTLRLPNDKVNVEVKEEKAVVKLPAALPEQITDMFSKKLVDLTKLKEVKIEVKDAEKKE